MSIISTEEKKGKFLVVADIDEGGFITRGVIMKRCDTREEALNYAEAIKKLNWTFNVEVQELEEE